MRWAQLIERSEVLPAKRALARFGAEALWAAVDTCPDLRRRLAWARALVLQRSDGLRGSQEALTRLRPVLWWVGARGDETPDDLEVPRVLPERWAVALQPGGLHFFTAEEEARAFAHEARAQAEARQAQLEGWCEVVDSKEQALATAPAEDSPLTFWWDACRRAKVPYATVCGFEVKHRALDGTETVLEEVKGAQFVPEWAAVVGPHVGLLRAARRQREED